ncbi:GPALPP motifs-containing protein 1 [Taenia solium]|eukprot:TsM_000749600 transcript=TsM_000749600 gene=TsM_000749600
MALEPISTQKNIYKETIDCDSHTDAETGDVGKETEARRIGPQLAPDAMAPSGGIGPALPEHLMRARMAAAMAADETAPINLGAIGPLPPGNEVVEELRHTSGRPENASSSHASPPSWDGLKRETWMTDYLPVSADPRVALKPRKFRQNPPPVSGVDTSWFAVGEGQLSHSTAATVTANVPKLDPHSKMLRDVGSARDDKMMAVANEYNKKHHRYESLLERHQRKRAREAERAKGKRRESSSSTSNSSSSNSDSEEKIEEEKGRKSHRKHKHRHHKKPNSFAYLQPTNKKKREKRKGSVAPGPTRQPFDRERDLLASRVDPLKRRAIIERSKQLSSRFAHGGQKFL